MEQKSRKEKAVHPVRGAKEKMAHPTCETGKRESGAPYL